MEVELSDTVEMVKINIQNMYDIPPREQVLIYRGKIMENDQTLHHCGVKKGCNIFLVLRLLGSGKKISVTSGKTLTLEVQSSDTVAKVKAKIYEKERLPLEHLRLLFAGKQLRDDKTLGYYKIEEQSILHWYFSSGEKIQIFVKTLDEVGLSLSLEVEQSDTIETIKEKIHEQKNSLAPNQIRLFFDAKQLESGKTLNDYGIKEGSSLYVLLSANRNMHIIVGISKGETLLLEVKTSDTAENVKAKIYDRVGITPRQMKLFFRGVSLEDVKILSDYDVQRGSTLQLGLRSVFTSEIFIEIFNEKTVVIEFDLLDTIRNFKKKIQQNEGISINQMILSYDGKLLQDGKTLNDYCITEGSTLRLQLSTRYKMQISITGITFTLDAQLSDTIEYIKAKICDKGDIPSNQLRLFSGGSQLRDGRTLDDYNIDWETPVHWFLISRGQMMIFAEDLYRKNLPLDVSSTDSIKQVKEKIQNLKGLSLRAFNIISEGKQLDDDKTLKDYNIQEGQTLRYVTLLSRNSYYFNFKIEI